MTERKLSTVESEESFDDDDIEDYIPTPPDGGWGWMIVLASLVCNIIVDGIGYSFGVLLPIFVEYFDAPKGKVALVGSLLCGVYLCAGPIVSGLVNKFGCRPVAFVGSLIAAGGFLIGSFSPTLEVLIFSYGVLGGIGFGMIYLPSIVSVGYYFESKRALATGIAVCGSGIGTFVFSPLNDVLLDIFDWRNVLFLQAGICLNCLVCAMLMRPLEPKKKTPKKISEEEKEDIRHHFRIIALKNRRPNQESESSVQDVKTFAKLREAKLMREKILNETESDNLSMPSAFFVKGNPDSNPGSPVGAPKISFSSNGSAHQIAPKIESPLVENKISESGDGDKDEKSEENRPPRGTGDGGNDEQKTEEKRLSRGVAIAAHEVQPLIENGYTKIKERKPKLHPHHAGSAARMSSHRDISKEDFKRPLYKQDIFYSGSICNIPQFRSQPDIGSYITSITSIPGVSEVPRSSIWDYCTCLPKSLVDTLKEMLDFSLMLDFNFLMLSLGNLFAMSGFYVPFTYLVDRAKILGISGTEAAFLLSVIGIANTIGRVLSGIIADHKKVDALVINNVALVISTISLFLQPLCTTYELLIVFSVVYGLCVSAYISLTSIIICDLLGLAKLTNAFGLLTLSRGIAGIYGPPLAGAVYEMTGNYDASFFLGGGLFLAGTLFHMVLHLPCVDRGKTPQTDQEMVFCSTDKTNNCSEPAVAV